VIDGTIRPPMLAYDRRQQLIRRNGKRRSNAATFAVLMIRRLNWKSEMGDHLDEQLETASLDGVEIL